MKLKSDSRYFDKLKKHWTDITGWQRLDTLDELYFWWKNDILCDEKCHETFGDFVDHYSNNKIYKVY